MLTFKVFPVGYDPHLATCNSVEDIAYNDKTYTIEDILQAKEMEKNPEIIVVSHKNRLPFGRWCQEIQECQEDTQNKA